MAPLTTKSIYFGSFLVTPQVFHLTQHSFALVNLKPLLPGHVLVSPLRVVPRLRDLTSPELKDLMLTISSVSRMLERVYKASGLNIAIQDGEDAGQSVPHVHAHIIPRNRGDMDERGGGDKLYELMDSEEGDVGIGLKQRVEERGDGVKKQRSRLKVDADEDRKPRTDEEMAKEAEWLAKEMESECKLRNILG